jgi:hypothetical protein
MPCPNGVNIPAVFDYFNYAYLYGDTADARFRYKVMLRPEQQATACIACGTCEELCPQKIAIREWMPKVTALLG